MTYFPTVFGNTLNNDALTLPFDLDGEFIAFVLVFNPSQQIESRSWLHVLDEAQHTYQSFSHYQLPVMNEFSPSQRSIIHASMRRSITDEDRFDTVIPLYVDKQNFRREINIMSEHSICVLLVDREGFIHWRTEGFASLLKQAQFRRALAHLVPQTAS